jgi:VWFA-related protein
MSVRSEVLLVLLLLGLLASPLAVQQPAPQQPTFRTRVDAVTVDVIATDSTGRPVTDLTAADFEVKESGKIQTIDSFKRITLDDERGRPDRPRAVPITSLDAQQREAARDDVRLVAIFLDEYHTRLGNAMSIREKLANFIATLDPLDMVAVMYPLTPTSALTFSRNHEGTARAVRKFEGRKYNYIPRYPQEEIYYRLSPRQIEDLRNEVVIGAVQGLCTYLGSFRDGRKTVLMVSEGLSSLLPAQIATGGRDSGGVSTGGSLDLRSFSRSVDLLNRMRDIFIAANRTNTSVYTLDPRGLAVSEFDLSQPSVDYGSDRLVLRESIDSLRTIADETDGRASTDTNDPVPLLRQMIVDTSAYYLLGYTSTEAPRDGKFHEIAVRSKRKGVELRSRKGYWAYSAEDFARATAPARPALPRDMADALASAASPATGHALRTWVGFDRSDASGQSIVTIVWEAAPTTPPRDTPDRVTITATGATRDVLFRARSTRDPQALTPSGRVTFTTRPGPVHVRVTAEGTSGQFLDSEARDLLVPDFTKVGPTVTTPEIYRARTSRELSQIRESTTALPTAVQQFSRTDHLLLRFRAHGPAGTTPAITIRLRNVLGETMATLPVPGRRPDGLYDVPIPLGGLASGRYLIEIEATSDADTSRVMWGFRITA